MVLSPIMTPPHPEARGPRGRPAASELEIRWEEAAAFLRRRLGYELPPAARDQVEDLAQEAMVRLLRAVRREPVENLDALMTEIARRTAIDHLRRRSRWRALVSAEPHDLEAMPAPGAEEPIGDPVERLQFIVLEFFTAREAKCRELAQAFFAEQDWRAVAEAQGRSHDAVRKQWSRCVELLRRAARDEVGPLLNLRPE